MLASDGQAFWIRLPHNLYFLILYTSFHRFLIFLKKGKNKSCLQWFGFFRSRNVAFKYFWTCILTWLWSLCIWIQSIYFSICELVNCSYKHKNSTRTNNNTFDTNSALSTVMFMHIYNKVIQLQIYTEVDTRWTKYT